MDNEAVLQDLNQTVVRYVQNDIKRAEAYQGSVIERTVKERYAIYYADKEYYRNKFPDVADTIEWALPSLMKVFTGSDEVITIAGVTEEDDTKAETMQELLVYQLQRQNKFFPILYNWMKDALITGMGIVKCYWERTEGFTTEQAVLNNESLQALIETGINVTDIQGPDAFGDFTVTYQSPYYVKNAPKIENILISEFIYSPDAKSLEEANFVAHKRKVTMSYLREREAQGVYANIDAIKPDSGYSVVTDPVQDVIGDNYNDIIGDEQKARQEVTIYECYTKIDVNNDGILEDMIITICGDTIIRMEQNYMGRHPFFAISPTKDPHRIWVKRSYAELIGELQDLKVALTRQIMQNVALTNDPKMLLDETAINIDDFVQGRKVIRMKAGHSLHEVAMPMNISPLSPQTFTFLEWIEGQKENRTGITRYNQGLDANSLNKTATGISAILGQSSQRLELVARMFAETGLYELFRFMVSLNQKFIDQQTVIRLTNKEMKITPEDLDGSFDLIVNAGISISTKESTIMATQTLLTAIMQANAAGYMISTPENVYNLFKKWIESIGFKNYGDYITDPAISQQRMLIEIQLKQQVLSQLPPDAMQYYAQFGILPPQYLNMLPPQLQVLFRGAGNEPGTQEQTNVAGNFGGTGFGGTNLSGGLATGLSRVDNQQPQNVQRGPSQGPTEPSRGIGGF